MNTENYYIEKELSWLSFNERVLQEAADKTVPIVERVRFLGIFSSNMDEFFRVRVAEVKRRILINQAQGSDDGARKLLNKIQHRVLKLQEDFDNIYPDVIRGLARSGIFLINEEQLSEEQGRWLRTYFRNKVLRHIAPIICTNQVSLSKVLQDDCTYLCVELRNPDKTQYALIEVPADRVPRFVELPKEPGKKRRTLILLDNIIRYCIEEVFRGFFQYERLSSYSMKMTRDADYGLSDDIDISLMEKMSLSLKQRLTAAPVRFVYDREMPESMIEYLKFRLGVTAFDAIIPGGRYHNFRDFIGFPNIGRPTLENPKQPALDSQAFSRYPTAFEAISAGDILLYYPYHKFRHFTEMLRQAAFDPAVEQIRISIYRVAKESRIIKSLVDAATNGKKITVVVELRARFDEEANIEWAKVLREAGVKVEFGVPSLKCHSKLCLINRRENGELVRYTHIGTGNFHERTAKVYTDFSLFTKHPAIGQEVEYVFEFIANAYKRFKFTHLLVSPNDNRKKLYRYINREIKHARAGLRAEIFIKINNLQDRGVITKLYEASAAGVKIRMIIRGVCCLVPGIPGVSDNIEAISIVDRYLEHPRVVVFYNNGANDAFISSSDWMTRNLDGRVEVGCPIYDPLLKQQLLNILELQWSDNTKAREIDKEQRNPYRSRGNKRKVRSQVAIYDYLKRLESNSREAAAIINPLDGDD
ncbi:MAG: polyphosphate kinase 1 [Corallincola sp.]|nr:polyphosphate kinase 1 [Corallincola sp.]